MGLKQDFLAALRSGTRPEGLLELVRRYQTQGTSPEDSYKALEEIWLEHGFDKSHEESPLRDDLEFVMEKVWYQGSKAG